MKPSNIIYTFIIILLIHFTFNKKWNAANRKSKGNWDELLKVKTHSYPPSPFREEVKVEKDCKRGKEKKKEKEKEKEKETSEDHFN